MGGVLPEPRLVVEGGAVGVREIAIAAGAVHAAIVAEQRRCIDGTEEAPPPHGPRPPRKSAARVRLHSEIVMEDFIRDWWTRNEGQVLAWRRHLHAHPELSHMEHSTTQFVADKLRDRKSVV